ncbi:hypothetical protein [Bacillus safensis]|uniref:hypothetical protein n=1 Tax=Bacillus safensis TaxID=561879 RepID=UPI003D77F59E
MKYKKKWINKTKREVLNGWRGEKSEVNVIYLCMLQADSMGRGNDVKDVSAMQKGLS